VKDHHLERHQKRKTYWGRTEVALLIEEAVRNSDQIARLSRIQICLIILIAFYTSSRGSSLGPYSLEYRAEGKYPRLGDAKFRKTGAATHLNLRKEESVRVSTRSCTR
jgi:hypothetical protein